MSDNPQYVQCYLRNTEVFPASFTTSWIELRGAKPGATVELITKHGKELWEVVRAFDGVKLPEDVLKETQRQRRTPPPSIRNTKKDKRQEAVQ